MIPSQKNVSLRYGSHTVGIVCHYYRGKEPLTIFAPKFEAAFSFPPHAYLHTPMIDKHSFSFGVDTRLGRCRSSSITKVLKSTVHKVCRVAISNLSNTLLDLVYAE
jgi:hypothetical protein